MKFRGELVTRLDQKTARYAAGQSESELEPLCSSHLWRSALCTASTASCHNFGLVQNKAVYDARNIICRCNTI